MRYTFTLYAGKEIVAQFTTDNRVNGYGTAEGLAVRYSADSLTVKPATVQRAYESAYRYLRENHSRDAATRILEDAMAHEGQMRKDDYGYGITYSNTDGYFYTEAASDVPPTFAPADVREQDRREFPHDADCPQCGRRQWTDERAQDTCQACGYTMTDDDV